MEIKRKNISSPVVIRTMLRPIDDMFEDWKQSILPSWAIKSYKCLTSTMIEPAYMSQYDTYPDLYVATMWNAYRSSRIMIHNHILTATLQHGSTDDMGKLSDSINILRALTTAICQSVPYFLSCTRDCDAVKLPEHMNTVQLSSSGALLLLWPLFSCGMLWTTPKEQSHWIASILRRIGGHMGLQLAISMAAALEGS